MPHGFFKIIAADFLERTVKLLDEIVLFISNQELMASKIAIVVIRVYTHLYSINITCNSDHPFCIARSKSYLRLGRIYKSNNNNYDLLKVLAKFF